MTAGVSWAASSNSPESSSSLILCSFVWGGCACVLIVPGVVGFYMKAFGVSRGVWRFPVVWQVVLCRNFVDM